MLVVKCYEELVMFYFEIWNKVEFGVIEFGNIGNVYE